MARKRKIAPRKISPIPVGEIAIDAVARRLIARVLRSGRLSYGPFSHQFESEVARLHECSAGVFCSSGTAALHLALAALAELDGWRPGDEVIVPSLTFMATLNSVSFMGLKPVLARVQPDTFNLDPEDVGRRIGSRTRCILPVHVLGLPSDMEAIAAMARRHRLRVVEDSCEAMFCGIRGRPVGSFGDAGCFSFAAGHVVTTGVGGMLVTKNGKLAAIARSLLNHGRDTRASRRPRPGATSDGMSEFRFVRRGFSYKLTELEAALGVAELKHWKQRWKRRRQIAARYRAALAPFAALVRPQAIPEGFTHACMAFGCVCRTPELRERLVGALTREDIETRPLFPVIGQPVADGLGRESEYPVAAHLGSCGIYLGCHPGLTDRDVNRVCATLHQSFASA